MFNQFANEINENADRLTFTLDGKNLVKTDTCSSQNINVASIIDAEINESKNHILAIVLISNITFDI